MYERIPRQRQPRRYFDNEGTPVRVALVQRDADGKGYTVRALEPVSDVKVDEEFWADRADLSIEPRLPPPPELVRRPGWTHIALGPARSRGRR